MDRLGQEWPRVRKFMVRKNSMLGGDASEDWVWLLSFLDEVDLFFSGLGLIGSRWVQIIGLVNVVKIDTDEVDYMM
jgi:hypothetical protein